MCLVATCGQRLVVASTDRKHFHYHKKFYQTALIYNSQKFWYIGIQTTSHSPFLPPRRSSSSLDLSSEPKTSGPVGIKVTWRRKPPKMCLP